MDEAKKLAAMEAAISEAAESRREDERSHPKVGAVITDREGTILLRAHRGEIASGHSEYAIFDKALQAGIDLSDKVLFVTLEPCTRRGPEKLPCAVRVLSSGIPEIHIGTLDPNPEILGRGELFLLSRGIVVERFPYPLAQRLREMNAEFFARHEHLIDPIIGFDRLIEEIQRGNTAIDNELRGNREGLLQSTLDLIVFSSGPIAIYSGALSWLRELQIGLLLTSMRGQPVRILCQKGNRADPAFRRLLEIARASGASVANATGDLGLRGTITSMHDERAAIIAIERDPALHAVLLRKPHEGSVVEHLSNSFMSMWNTAIESTALKPIIRPLTLEFVADALRSGVRAYEKCSFEVAPVNMLDLQLLSANVERFKLYRVGVVEKFKQENKIADLAAIEGSPWPMLPPIVEVDRKGRMTLIDGMHRAYYWIERGRYEIDAIVINGVREPLPAVPIGNFGGIVVTQEWWPREMRYSHYNSEHFRKIRSSMERALMTTQ